MFFRFDLETTARPEQVFHAFVDFSASRLEVWKQTLDPKKYEVREVGDGWAVAKEGSPGSWVLLRYEWSAPGTIHWSVIDTSYCRRGTGDITISPLDSGGSRVDAVLDHSGPKGLGGAVVLLMQRVIGPLLFPRLWKSALDRLAATESPSG